MSPPASIIWKSFWLQIQLQALLMFHVKTCELLGQDIWISMILQFMKWTKTLNTRGCNLADDAAITAQFFPFLSYSCELQT